MKFLKLCFRRIFVVTPKEVTSISSYYVQAAYPDNHNSRPVWPISSHHLQQHNKLIQNIGKYQTTLYIKSAELKHVGETVYGHLHVSVRPSMSNFFNVLPMAIKYCNDSLSNNLSV
jgi:hypothetical protein